MRVLLVLAMGVVLGLGASAQADPPSRQRGGPNRGEMQKRMVEKYDANKDGKLDDKEKEAIKAEFAKRREAMQKQMLEKYDTNKDGVLTANEWSSMSKNIAPADTNGDARVTVQEYARFMNQ